MRFDGGVNLFFHFYPGGVFGVWIWSDLFTKARASMSRLFQ